MIKALLFDLDDTLYPEKKFVDSGFKTVSHAMADKLGIRQTVLYGQLIRTFRKGSRGKIFDIALKKIGVQPSRQLISEMVHLYRIHTPKIKPYDDVPTCLRYLTKMYRLGLITDGYGDIQRRKIEALSIDRFFQLVIFSDDLSKGNWKPSPVPYEAALSKFHVLPHEAIYVGDNPYKDFIAARQLGLTTVRIKRKGGEYSSIRLDAMHEADHEIKSLEELDMLVRSIDRIDDKQYRSLR